MNRFIYIILFCFLLLVGCNNEDEKKGTEKSQIEIAVQNNKDIQVILVGSEEKVLEVGQTFSVEKNTPFALKLLDGRKTWIVDNIETETSQLLDITSYQFEEEQLVQTLKDFGLEHVQAMAWKDSASWSTVTQRYIQNTEGDYINETLYEGQFEKLLIDMDSFVLFSPNEIKVTAYMDFNEVYYMPFEGELLYETHSHAHNDGHSEEMEIVSYLMDVYFLKENNQWKIDKMEFLKEKQFSTNVIEIVEPSNLFIPTKEAEQLASYLLDIQQVEVFLEQFYEEYVKAFNFKNTSYLEPFVSGKTIFHEAVEKNIENKMVELLGFNILSMTKKEENQYELNVQMQGKLNSKNEILENHFFIIKKNNRQFFIM